MKWRRRIYKKYWKCCASCPRRTKGCSIGCSRDRITPEQLDQLSRLSFVRPTTEGIALHDVARAYLSEDFIRRDPKRYYQLLLQIVDDECRLLKTENGQEKSRIAARLLAICRDMLPFGILNGSTDPLIDTLESFRPG